MSVDRKVLRPLWIAGRLLSRFPFPDPGQVAPAELGRAVPWYPVIGLLVGLAIGLVAALLGPALLHRPAGVAAALVLILWVWCTGGLHLDGLADTADAWVGGQGSRERTLAIMKDPASGPAGVSALVLVLIAKWAALTALIGAGDGWSLLWVPPARAGAVAAAADQHALCPSPRDGGRSRAGGPAGCLPPGGGTRGRRHGGGVGMGRSAEIGRASCRERV